MADTALSSASVHSEPHTFKPKSLRALLAGASSVDGDATYEVAPEIRALAGGGACRSADFTGRSRFRGHQAAERAPTC